MLVFAIVGGSVALLTLYGVLSCSVAVISDEFQTYLPLSTGDDDKLGIRA
jgi:hypothetical protein